MQRYNIKDAENGRQSRAGRGETECLRAGLCVSLLRQNGVDQAKQGKEARERPTEDDSRAAEWSSHSVRSVAGVAAMAGKEEQGEGAGARLCCAGSMRTHGGNKEMEKRGKSQPECKTERYSERERLSCINDRTRAVLAKLNPTAQTTLADAAAGSAVAPPAF